MTLDKRNAFRVEEAARISIEPVADDEWEERLALLAGSLSANLSVRQATEEISLEISRKMIAVNRVSTTVAGCLDLLNKKLEIMLDHIGHLEHQRGDLGDIPATRCELSSSGVQFPSAEPFATGQRVYFRALLITHIFYFEALAEVTRCEPATDGSGFQVAAVFRGLRDADRDSLIKHLLHRQSETIRRKRLEQDELAAEEAQQA